MGAGSILIELNGAPPDGPEISSKLLFCLLRTSLLHYVVTLDLL